MEVEVFSIGGGYHCDVVGTIDDRPFHFREKYARWGFGVSKLLFRTGVDPIEQFNVIFPNESDAEFLQYGTHDLGPLWYSEAVPLFINALERYLHHHRYEEAEQLLSRVQARIDALLPAEGRP